MLKTSQLSAVGAKIPLARWASRLLYILVVFLPLVLWAGPLFSFEGVKKYFFLFGTLIIAALYLFNSWQERHFYRLSSLWLVALWAIPLSALLASLASPSPRHSLIGLGIETDTFLFIVFLSLLATLVPLLWRGKREVFNALLAVLSTGAIVLLFQTLRLAVGNFTTLGVFSSTAANLIGKWNELGIFAGLIFILSLAFIKFLPWRRTPVLTGLVLVNLVLSFLLIIFINFWLLSAAVGVSVLLIWLSTFKKGGQLNWRSAKTYLSGPLLVAIFLLLFSWLGQPGNFATTFKTQFDPGVFLANLSTARGVQVVEVSPSWSGTWEVAKSVLTSRPIFGVGPNKFASQWFRGRPVSVNETPFWQDDFRSGVGLVPSSFVTMGLVGLASYLLLLLVILWSGYRLWRERSKNDSLINGLNTIIFVLTAYLWFFNITYVPGVVILALTSIFTGLLITSQYGFETEDSSPANATNSKFASFFATFGVSGGLIACFILLALLGQSFWSNLSYNRGLIKAFSGDLTGGEVLIANATSLNPNDIFYRSLIDLDLSYLNQLLQEQNDDQEAVRARFQTILSAGIGNGQAATAYNPANYLNWVYLGQVYESVVPLKIEGAYEEALKAYTKAKDLNPSLPLVWLNLARLEITASNDAKGREYLDQALKLKRNYTEAIFVLAQLDAKSGNLSRAIALAEQSSQISGGDPVAFFSVGLLKYQDNNFLGARDALEQAVALNPNYANARYFLGLAYDRLGSKAKALEQFQIILTNNDLPEIKQIILNLQAGRGALTNTPPPAPEDRSKLPVEEDSN